MCIHAYSHNFRTFKGQFCIVNLSLYNLSLDKRKQKVNKQTIAQSRGKIAENIAQRAMRTHTHTHTHTHTSVALDGSCEKKVRRAIKKLMSRFTPTS